MHGAPPSFLCFVAFFFVSTKNPCTEIHPHWQVVSTAEGMTMMLVERDDETLSTKPIKTSYSMAAGAEMTHSHAKSTHVPWWQGHRMWRWSIVWSPRKT